MSHIQTDRILPCVLPKPYRSWQRRAEDHAKLLDAQLALAPDDVTRERIITAGRMLSDADDIGFVSALECKLCSIEADVLDDAEPGDYVRSSRSNDPEAYRSDRLEDDIDEACEEFCRLWMADAEAAMLGGVE